MWIRTITDGFARWRQRGPRLRATPRTERLFDALLFACGTVSILVTIGIVAVLVFETAAFFREVPVAEFLLDSTWTPLNVDAHFGVWALISGTLLTSAVAIGVALPLGLMAAIYLSEYAAPRTRAILKPALELLAGVPTIVYGFFALTIVTPLLQKVVPNLAGFNALSPGIVMGIMIVPMVSSLSEDALHAVPRHLREAAFGLGASKPATIFGVVLPSAFSGIAASATLAVSRAIGETMVVAIAAGQQARVTVDPRVPIETMTSYIVNIAKGDVAHGTLEFRTLFAVGSTLFLMTMVMNVLSYRLASRMRRKSVQ